MRGAGGGEEEDFEGGDWGVGGEFREAEKTGCDGKAGDVYFGGGEVLTGE